MLPKDSGSTFWEGVQEEAGVAKYIRVTLPAVPLSPHPTCPDLCGKKVGQAEAGNLSFLKHKGHPSQKPLQAPGSQERAQACLHWSIFPTQILSLKRQKSHLVLA